MTLRAIPLSSFSAASLMFGSQALNTSSANGIFLDPAG